MQVPILSGQWVALEPLDASHREPLRRAADDDRIWETTLTRAIGAGFDHWFAEAIAERESGIRFPFAVRRLADQACVGSTSYLDITPGHKRLEIGATWYNPASWGTTVNPECKLLLMSHAFDVLGVQRIAYITDALNRRSRAAIAKLGATREGILRAHMISQGGRIRDSVVFSIVAAEWPPIRRALQERIAETATAQSK